MHFLPHSDGSILLLTRPFVYVYPRLFVFLVQFCNICVASSQQCKISGRFFGSLGFSCVSTMICRFSKQLESSALVVGI